MYLLYFPGSICFSPSFGFVGPAGSFGVSIQTSAYSCAQVIYSDSSDSAQKTEIRENIVCDMECPGYFRGDIRCSIYIIACE